MISEDDLVRYCAPTLAGIKTGSLFLCPCDSVSNDRNRIRMINRLLCKKGIRLLLLRRSDTRILLYLYRPERLQRDLMQPAARALLSEAGYADLRWGQCLRELIRRLRSGDAFPHEIGLFLSYPPEDVRGFMEHKGRDCILRGLWKVYGDPARAMDLFRRYRSCTNSYRRQRLKGVSLERLAVAESYQRKAEIRK